MCIRVRECATTLRKKGRDWHGISKMQSKVDKRTKEVCVIFSSTLYTLLPKVKILLQIITTKVSAGVSTHIGDLKIFLCLIIFYNPYRRRWQFR